MRPVNSGGTIWRRLAHRSSTACICAVFHAITTLANRLSAFGHGLQLVRTSSLGRRDAAGIDRALERVHRFATVEHPSQLTPETDVDEIVGWNAILSSLPNWMPAS